MDLGSQVEPSAEPKILTSSDSCSMILVMERVPRNTRLAAPLRSTAWPSPLAVATVPGGTRTDSAMAVVIAGDSNKKPAWTSGWNAGRCTQRRCKQRLYDCHSDGCGAGKSLQQGFCAGLNSISSMRTKSGSNTLSCHLPSLPICECSLPCSFQPCDSRM